MKTSNRTSSPAHIRQIENGQRSSSKFPPPAHSGGGKLSSRPQSADLFQTLGVMNLSRPNSHSPGPSISPFAASAESSPYPRVSPQASNQQLSFNISNVPVIQAAGLVCHPNIPLGGQALPFPFAYSFDGGGGGGAHVHQQQQLDQSANLVAQVSRQLNSSAVDTQHLAGRSSQALLESLLHERTIQQQVAFAKNNYIVPIPPTRNVIDYPSSVGHGHHPGPTAGMQYVTVNDRVSTSIGAFLPETKNMPLARPAFLSQHHVPQPQRAPISVNPVHVDDDTTLQLLRRSASALSDGRSGSMQGKLALPAQNFGGVSDISATSSSRVINNTNRSVSQGSLSTTVVNDRTLSAGTLVVDRTLSSNSYGHNSLQPPQQFLFPQDNEMLEIGRFTSASSVVNNNNSNSFLGAASSSQQQYRLPTISSQHRTVSSDFQPPVLVAEKQLAVSNGKDAANSIVAAAPAPAANSTDTTKPAMRHPPIPKKRIFLPSPERADAETRSATSSVATSDVGQQLDAAQTSSTDQEQVNRPEEKLVPIKNPFNMRVVNLNNFIASSTHRTTGRSQTQSIAVLRAKAGAITNAAKSLDLLRQLLQQYINQEIDVIIKKYLEDYFLPGIENIKINQGETSVDSDHIQAICCQILEEAKKMYDVVPRDRGTDDVVTPDCGVIKKPLENQFVRANKLSLFHIRKRKSSSDFDIAKKRKKPTKVSQPSSVPTMSGRNTPSKGAKTDVPPRDLPLWNPSRLKESTQFVIGSRANRALGLGQTRGRLYIKHPDVFKYLGDQEDKQWLCERHYMPATGGKSYIVIVDDIRQLAASAEYKDSPDLELDALVGFTVPEWMLVKMRAHMVATSAVASLPLPTSSTSQTLASNDAALAKDTTDSGSDLLPDLPDTRPATPALTLEVTEGVSPVVNGNEDDDLALPSISPVNFGTDTNNSPSPARSDVDNLDFSLPVRFAM